MWVPGLAGKKSGEVGHPAYQHPRRLKEGTYNQEVDRFPAAADRHGVPLPEGSWPAALAALRQRRQLAVPGSGHAFPGRIGAGSRNCGSSTDEVGHALVGYLTLAGAGPVGKGTALGPVAGGGDGAGPELQPGAAGGRAARHPRQPCQHCHRGGPAPASGRRGGVRLRRGRGGLRRFFGTAPEARAKDADLGMGAGRGGGAGAGRGGLPPRHAQGPAETRPEPAVAQNKPIDPGANAVGPLKPLDPPKKDADNLPGGGKDPIKGVVEPPVKAPVADPPIVPAPPPPDQRGNVTIVQFTGHTDKVTCVLLSGQPIRGVGRRGSSGALLGRADETNIYKLEGFPDEVRCLRSRPTESRPSLAAPMGSWCTTTS